MVQTKICHNFLASPGQSDPKIYWEAWKTFPAKPHYYYNRLLVEERFAEAEELDRVVTAKVSFGNLQTIEIKDFLQSLDNPTLKNCRRAALINPAIAKLKELHNGLIKCPYSQVGKYLPEILPILECVDTKTDLNNYYVDAKVHMLMPGQFPCIPGWHRDGVPRDEKNNLLLRQIDPEQKMYLWFSGQPATEFKYQGLLKSQTWYEFTQSDVHRCRQSTIHTWRLFIRLMPSGLVARPRSGDRVLRRHTQVYLDSKNFTW